MTTRDELVELTGGEIVGGNVVKNNICYGRMTEGVFTLTEEGKALLAESAEELAKPAKPRAKPAGKRKGDDTQSEAAQPGEVDIDLD